LHDTAYAIGRSFFACYVQPEAAILEIGSMNVNGGLRDFCPAGSSYTGVDFTPGPGVDLVVEQVAKLPFDPGAFDAVVSSSAFEHDAMFWVTFLEICRVVKEGGYIYINAPSKGDYHCHPIDAWRFFPDSGVALCTWARLNGYHMTLLESFITQNDAEVWNDCVMIFGKRAYPPVTLVTDRHPNIMNVRIWPDIETVDRRVGRWP